VPPPLNTPLTNSNLGLISHRLAAIACNGLQFYSRSTIFI